jgi:Domain of unknown function (DUF4124)
MRSIIPLLACALTVPQVWGETCKYVDKDGHVTYSNAPVVNARKVSCIQAAPPSSTDKPNEPGKPSEGKTQDAGKPHADLPLQTKSNDERRRILEEELVQEQEALGKARSTLAEQETIRSGDERNYARVLERLKPFQDAIVSHEQRIKSIKQELSNLK